ncbi:MAG TPA: sodium:alanine symporter family protein [Armatimonadetes bacterium]|nr:sodium:alanine symporter family protein [Armatimonadota bacterium]
MDLTALTERLGQYVWGSPMVVLLLGTGIFLTIRLKVVQLRHFKHGLELISGKYDDPSEEGDITHFQALSAALSATIGTGNIVGVATAIASGGPGALFWMWITGFLGMVNKFASAALGLKYRVIHEDGSASGGPMYYLEKGLGQRWLGLLFALFTMVASLGIGCMVQSNSVADALHDTFGVPPAVTGIVMASLVALVVFGGIRRIGRVASRLTPGMCLLYMLGAIVILLHRTARLPQVFALIFQGAFRGTAAKGGFLGVTVRETIRYGVARGLFSNEAGLGSASIAHSAAKTSEPVREGLVAMLGPFVDTIVVCTLTGLVILTTGAWTEVGENGTALIGAPLSNRAFELGLPRVGSYLVTCGLALFAFSTVLSWPYYGDRSAEYLFGRGAITPYRVVHVLLLMVGAVTELRAVWNISDIMNGFMAFPNLIGILGLSGVLARELAKYFASDAPRRVGPARGESSSETGER